MAAPWPPYDEAKFREFVLYVASRSESDPDFGSTKLNKILFFAEFLAYGKLQRPITGAVFQKLNFGPAARRLLPVQEQLECDQAAAIQHRDRYGHRQERLVALREPDLSRFTGAEIAIIDDVLRELLEENAVSVSDLSHRFLGWQLARYGEEIPYETVFLSGRELTQAEKDYALELAGRDGV